ncbi:MAG: M48 family metallopeptidase [Gammaproteobacteria bacterium]|nr:M48 family metallopeptidase [Gammaproteobacteria bacterium]
MPDSMAYHWRRSPRAKQLQVRITPWQGIEVVIPRHYSKRRVRAFLASQQNWIRATWQRMKSQIVDAECTLPAALDLRAIGEYWRINYQRCGSIRKHAAADAQTGILTVYADPSSESGCRRALRGWLTRRARESLGMQAAQLGQVLGCGYRRLQIRGQKSRWGSCSSNKTLSLNYKLLFLEPELVRYLLVHELMHLRVLDHSQRFWKLVATHEPGWRQLDEDLGEAWRDVPAWVEIP